LKTKSYNQQTNQAILSTILAVYVAR